MAKNFQSEFEAVQQIYMDVEELDPRERHRGELAVVMTNLMIAQAITQLRMDLNAHLSKLYDSDDDIIDVFGS